MGNLFLMCAFMLLSSAAVWASEEHSLVWERAIHEGRRYQRDGQYPKALEKFLEALRQADACKSSRECMALTLNDLASVYSELGSYSKTRECSRRSIKIFEQSGLKVHPGFAASLNNLAMAEMEMGQYGTAEKLLRQSTGVRITTFGEGHPHVASSFMNLAGLYVRVRRYREAETLYRRALEIWESNPELHQADIARCLNNLAALYRSQDRAAEAIPRITTCFGRLGKNVGRWTSSVGKGGG